MVAFICSACGTHKKPDVEMTADESVVVRCRRCGHEKTVRKRDL